MAAFAAHEVDHLVVRGHAVGGHARPRFTNDIDLWVGHSPENLKRDANRSLAPTPCYTFLVSMNRIEQVKSMIRDAFVPYRKDLRDHRVMFFGSRVTGKARERSDFDVAIDGSGPVDPRLLGSIREQLDALPTLYRIDLVDLATVTDRVRAEMLRHTETIL